ncbi:Carboxypeptidase Y [Zancudomyces culisetae]|uniref:Carboxypeptidase n=1 Tax=Zancudomyces culisetae TaxID=1213189 RepID=A0A1R1PD44_ZANCU|nr:Carboxypeptidase Y [Zancudomyces culisetae]|eukprot:OMH78914.1 Carboxypeptidase Y [Zancudomyces culisetae]
MLVNIKFNNLRRNLLLCMVLCALTKTSSATGEKSDNEMVVMDLDPTTRNLNSGDIEKRDKDIVNSFSIKAEEPQEPQQPLFFESQTGNKNAPLILWLNGGPGCSSLTGLFMENGPCRVNPNGDGTVTNDYSWNKNAHMLYLDQPLGTGFSYGNPSGYNSSAIADDAYAFLKMFLENFTQYDNSEVHLFGESYAGHYIPEIGKKIFQENQESNKNNGFKINLKSIGIGNGYIDPLEQVKYFGKMACDSTYPKALSDDKCRLIDEMTSECTEQLAKCQSPELLTNDDYPSCGPEAERLACAIAYYPCNKAIDVYADYRNIHDVRSNCDVPTKLYLHGYKGIEYLNKKDIQDSLGAEISKFEVCNDKIHIKFVLSGDYMRSQSHNLAYLLDNGIKVLNYAGDADWICNWMGIEAVLKKLEWSGRAEYNSAEERKWMSKKIPITEFSNYDSSGMVKSYGGLTYIKIYEAEHMAPYSQPENTLDMVNKWISGIQF